MPSPFATWNRDRDIWETDQPDLLSGHSGVFSETWPASGMTRSGVAFEHPMSVPRTGASGSSLLHTPKASRGAATSENVALLVTPTAQLATNGGSQPPAKRRAGGHGPTLADQIEHL